MQTCVIDFESFYSNIYSLSKMTTEEYVRAPLFETIGFAAKFGNHPTDWIRGDQAAPALAKIDWSDKMVIAQNCVTGDHEVRTPHGWVRFDRLQDGTPILQWDPSTAELTYVIPTVVRNQYEGEMLEWDTKFHAGIYTPDHRMYVRTPDVSEWRAVAASEVAGRSQNNQYVPVGGVYEPHKAIPLTPLDARILEMIRADGHLPRTNNTARLTFMKGRKIERAKTLLDAWGVKYVVRTEGEPRVVIDISPDERLSLIRKLLGVGSDKKLGEWVLSLSAAARKAMLDEAQYWDGFRASNTRGSSASKTACVVHSAKREDIVWLAEAAVLSGLSAKATFDIPNIRGWSRPDSVLHRVSLRQRDRAKLVSAPTKRNFSGTVYCVQVPTKAFLVRRNGRTWVTGNCAFDGAIMGWRYGIKPAVWVDIMGMSRALFPHEKSHSLAAQAERAGIGTKGDEVIKALGKRLVDFTPEELHRYGQYCINDVELTYKLFNRYMEMGFPKKELRLLDLTLRMFIEPELVLDKPLLEQHYRAVVESKSAMLEKVRDKLIEGADPDYIQAVFAEGLDGIRKLLMSNDKFAYALEMFGVVPPMKKSPTTGKMTYAFAKTDEAFKALEEHEDPAVQALVAARLSNKTTLEETRTLRFIGMSARGKFPVPLRYYGAHSGRWSGEQSVNLQNLPSRGPQAGKIKKAIKAPPGYVVIDCDSAQIEARTLAWLAGQDDLVHAFRLKQDVYKLMASKIYGVKPDDVDKLQRQVGKTVVLGAGYGVGHVKLQSFLKVQAGVEVTLEEAKRIIDTYRASAYKIKELWDMGNQGLRALLNGQSLTIDAVGLIRAVPGKGLTLPNGLHIQYPELRMRTDTETQKTEVVYTSKGLPVRIYGGKVVENICQAVARCIVAEQMLRVAKFYRPVLTVHDAIAIIAPESEAKVAQECLEEAMSWNPKWAAGLPLACESGVGQSYGDC